MSGIHCTAHVAHGGDPIGAGMNCPSPNSKRDHQHTGNRTARDPVEGGGCADIHLSTHNSPVELRLTWIQGRKRDGDSYNGIEDIPRAC